jgi:pimeloyl-ACP methyl ester carboxylesterase
VQGISAALAASRQEGTMEAFVKRLESWFGERLPEPVRTWTLENDPGAIDAAWRSALAEGPVSEDLTAWSVPCLIYAGADDQMHDSAEKAAAEIPGATFVSLARCTHLSAADEVNGVLPHVLDLFSSVRSEP